ncbi:hypothetical protein [Niastella sp. OAS944]|uniref:hypothetical protein n=1 Tax=Niastella sp. OAS944 TaxID=2664089 RepID=UPI0034720499|nr:hypothetical protein [Chitinophagaceae bacterium OAS944]
MQKLQNLLKAPLHFQWLILFFVLHGYNEFFGLIKVSSLVLLILQYSAVAWVLYYASRKMYKDGCKGALLATVLCFCFLFFGAIQDELASHSALYSWSLFTRLIPAIGLLSLLVFAGLFFYKKPLFRFTRFLNALLLLLIMFEMVLLAWQAATAKPGNSSVPVPVVQPLADTAAKPDVYLVLLDEYLGTAGLKEYYHYNNETFESYLKQKGFYVCTKPSSNYSYTIYSMASLLNMTYLDSTVVNFKRQRDTYKNLANMIDHNAASFYFKRFNYSIQNLSPFVVDGIDTSTSVPIVPRGIELITSRALYIRVLRRIIFGEPQDKLNIGGVSAWLNKGLANTHERQMQNVLSSAGRHSPSFTYLHLVMPHKPYIYDSTGKVPDVYKTVSDHRLAGNDKLYLQYLVYANKRITRFLEELFAATQGKAVIMVMSDHGNRDAHNMPGRDFSFQNFNAVYLPNRDYHLWYDSVSNVNQFPLLFNTLFGQQIQLKADSTHF